MTIEEYTKAYPLILAKYEASMERWRWRKRKDFKLWLKRNPDKKRARARKYFERRFSKPIYRQKEIERLYKYLETHPFCNMEKMERLIKIYERTTSLDKPIGDDANLYHFIPDRRAI